MTAVASAGSPGGTSRRSSKVLPWIVGIVALAFVGIVAGRPGSNSGGVDFDPGSTAPDGAKGLVLLLESFGADVDTTSNLPTGDTDIAFMFDDVVAEADQPFVDDWVRAGGVLVVADPYSVWNPPLADGSDTSGFGLQPSDLHPAACDIESLSGLETIEPGAFSVAFEVPAESQACFTDSDIGEMPGPFVVEQRVGRGRIVSIGSPTVFVNEWLDESDNAALATGLLLTVSDAAEAAEGSIDVALLQYGGTGVDDDRSLSDVMGTGAKITLVQLMAAFLVYAWYRARHVGKPIVEPQPVALAGSELVSAVGQLLQQSDDPDRSARALRADLRRRLGERFGLGPNATSEAVATVVAERTGADRDRLLSIVGTRPVTTDRELVQLAAAIDDLRKEILHGP